MKKHSVLFNTSIIYFTILIMFVIVRIVVQVVDFNIDNNLFDLLSTIVVQCLILFLFPIIIFSLTQKQKPSKTFSDFGYGKINLFSLIVSVFIGFFCYFLNLSIASFFGGIIKFLGYESTPSSGVSSAGDYSILAFFLNVLTVAILPAICEETTHRGLLLKGFSSLGLKLSIILSSLLFGLMHLNINQFFYATVLGFVIALTVIISKNIFPAIIIHFMNNFLSVYFSFARANNWFGKGFYQFFTTFLYSENLIVYFITNLLTLIALVMFIVMLFTILLKETRIKKVKNMLNDIAKINSEYKADSSDFRKDENFMNLHNLNTLMQQYNIKSLNSMVFTDLENKTKKPTASEIIVLTSCFVVGILITAFTFIWGVL